ncbi:hypothetical protein [Rheinheimera sp.]|uniref:hypothetical protein n=1 Tax=Rheinheimera sp. TaxID=1869214 RepID=UPI00307D3BB3
MSKLAQFIEELATNTDLQQQYIADAAGTMQSYGLAQNEIDAVLSGDKAQVEKLTGQSVKAVMFYHIP